VVNSVEKEMMRELTEKEMKTISAGNWFTWLLGYCFQGQYNSMSHNKFQASVMPYK
jgi:hypothetical protein